MLLLQSRGKLVKIMDFETLLEIIEARRGNEKLALLKKENAREYLRDFARKEGS